ncbi:hypothetical protein BD560DRAFT_339223 [Blakeslea trispora]|nr:hypothetical protein BD560DRAFT_339223 [Blakeslea trispora]
MDQLQLLGKKIGQERLFFLLDRSLGQEDRMWAKVMKVIEARKGIEIGDQVLRTRALKRGKLDSNYQHKPYTVIGRFHKNTFILIDSQGRKLKRAINGAHLKKFNVRDSSTLKVFKNKKGDDEIY